MKKNQDGFVNEIYETSLSINDRKAKGIYYTPPELVTFMINLITVKKNSKILEAGCGVGNFVIPLIKKLNKISNQTKTSNKTLQKILSNNIFAFDFDSNAIKILKNSISVNSPNIKSSSFLLETSFDNDEYDVVIGNPPYNAKLSKKEKDYCKTYYPDISKTIRSETFFVIKPLVG